MMPSRSEPQPAPVTGERGATVRALDVPLRVFHGSLVALVAMAYVSRRWGDAALVWHTWNGYAILVLIVWRVFWGFTGRSTARFKSLFAWPWTAASAGIDVTPSRPRQYLGHNPLGAAVVFALLGFIGLEGVLGLIANGDRVSKAGGPLASKVSEVAAAAASKWHIFLFDVILAIAALYILAVILLSVWKGHNPIKPMLTERKPAGGDEDQPETAIAAAGKALVCQIASVLLVLGGIMTAGG